MDIRNEIQCEIDVNSGSEIRVIEGVKECCNCSDQCVREQINWLVKNGYVKIVKPSEMSESEKRYCQSDRCSILRNASSFDEIKFQEEKAKQKQIIGRLQAIDRFKAFVSKMEEEFCSGSFFNGRDYDINYRGNAAIITVEGQPIIEIDFEKTSDLAYNESDNSIFYKADNDYWIIKLFYMSGKCHLKHCKG